MNSKNDLLLLGELYDRALGLEPDKAPIINEARRSPKKKSTLPTDTFKVIAGKGYKEGKASPKAFQKKSGPEAADNFKSDAIDAAKLSKKALAKNIYEPGKFSQKNESTGINNDMSKKFDELFNNVVSGKLRLEANDTETVEDVAELPELSDIEGTEDLDGLGDLDKEKTKDEIIDEIISLLDQLRDEDPDLEADLDAEPVPSDDLSKEETELEEVKDSAGQSLQNKNNKVSSSIKVAGGKAHNVSGSYKQTINDGEAKESDLNCPKKKPEVAGSTVKVGRSIGS